MRPFVSSLRMAPAAKRTPEESGAPTGFRVRRDLPVGRHPLLAAFPGLDRMAAAERLVTDPTARAKLFDETCVHLVDQDLWMYVAPFEMPKAARREWRPITSPGSDCIVIGENHLRESPGLMLFMDIFHELCHLVQRAEGADLWPPGVSYVKRWTEVEAYRFVVEEARRLRVSDDFLREYLRVEWISEDEHLALLSELKVPAS